MITSTYFHERPTPFAVNGHRHKSMEESVDQVSFRMNLLTFLPGHINTFSDPKILKNPDNPVKPLNHGDHCANENRPHDQGARNFPKKNHMQLKTPRPQVSDYQQGDETVVDNERFIEETPAQQLAYRLPILAEVYDQLEKKGHGKAESSPKGRMIDFCSVILLIEQTKA